MIKPRYVLLCLLLLAILPAFAQHRFAIDQFGQEDAQMKKAKVRKKIRIDSSHEQDISYYDTLGYL
jgi:hypothetical protein